MKRSQKVTIGLIVAAAAGVIGYAATQADDDDPDCYDNRTGKEVSDKYCRDAYAAGYIGGPYSMRYPNGASVDAGDRDKISKFGGFGSPDGAKSFSSGG